MTTEEKQEEGLFAKVLFATNNGIKNQRAQADYEKLKRAAYDVLLDQRGVLLDLEAQKTELLDMGQTNKQSLLATGLTNEELKERVKQTMLINVKILNQQEIFDNLKKSYVELVGKEPQFN